MVFFLPLMAVLLSFLSFAQTPSPSAAVLCRCTLQVEQVSKKDPHSLNLMKAQEWCVNYVNTILEAKEGPAGESPLTAQARFHSFQPDHDVYVCEAKNQGNIAGFGSSHEEAKENAYQSCLTVMKQHLEVYTQDIEYKVHPDDVSLEDCTKVNPQTSIP